jgi:hypothetical protein
MPDTNTLCPKIGAAQWTCTRDECTCHLKESIPVRRRVVDLSADEMNAHAVAAFNGAARKHGAAIACATATRRPSYEEAVKHRPRGACYCDLDDRACYMAGHWHPTST